MQELQDGRRDGPILQFCNPHILQYPYLLRSDTSVRFTKFWPDAYASAYCL